MDDTRDPFDSGLYTEIVMQFHLRVPVFQPVQPPRRQVDMDALFFEGSVKPLILAEAKHQYARKVGALRRLGR